MGTTDTGATGRIEADFERAIGPALRTRRGVFAGAPLGVVAVMILASVAFGASVVKVAIDNGAQPTAAIVGGADPTDEPTAPATIEPIAQPTLARPTISPEIRPVATAPAPTVPGPSQVADMGTLTVADNLDLTVSFAWNAFSGGGLTAYALVYENTSSGVSPSYPDSDAWGTAPAGRTALAVPGVPAGDYQVRVQALCGPASALVVCGQTGVAHVHLSAARGVTPIPTSPPTPVRTAPPATATPTRAPTPAPHTPAPTDAAPTAPAPTIPAPTSGPIFDLGALTVLDNLDRTISFSWHAYTGPGLTAYAVFAEVTTSGQLPTYPVSVAWRTTPAAQTNVSMTPEGPGTFNVRVQALCGTGSNLHVCGQTAIVRVHLSQAMYGNPTPTPAA